MPKNPTPVTAARTPDDEARASVDARDEAEGQATAESDELPAVEAVATSGELEDARAEELVKKGYVTFEDNGREDLAKQIAGRRGVDEPEDDEEEADQPGEGQDEPPATVREPGEVTPVTAAPKGARKINVADLEPDAVVTVKVNGKPLEIAVSDLVGGAQKWLAGDDYLRQGKEILDSAKRAAPDSTRTSDPAAGQNQPPRRDVQPPGARTARTKVDPKDLVDVVDAIATGTAEDGAEKLAAALNRTLEGAENQGDVEQVVERTLAERDQEAHYQSTVSKAISDLRAAHPALDKMPAVTDAVFRRGYEGMLEELRRIEVPPEQLNQPAPFIIKEYVRLSRDPKLALKPVKDVYEAATVSVETELGIKPAATNGNGRPQPVVRTTEARVVRKTTTPVQPRSAGIKAEPGATPVARTRNASATIDAMRQQREEGLTLQRR